MNFCTHFKLIFINIKIEIETQSTSSSFEIQVELNEQSSLASSTFSSELADTNSQKINYYQNNCLQLETSISSNSLNYSHNQQYPIETNENIFLKDNALRRNESKANKRHLASNIKSGVTISEPKEINRTVNEQEKNLLNHFKNDFLDEEVSIERSSANTNFLNIGNDYYKRNSLARFRSSSPRETSPNHKSSLIENESSEDLFNFQNSRSSPIVNRRLEDKKYSINNTPNQAVESSSTPGPLGDIQVTKIESILFVFYFKTFFFVKIQVKHDSNEQRLIVKILRATNLPSKDANGYSDPFVKIYLLPGRE